MFGNNNTDSGNKDSADASKKDTGSSGFNTVEQASKSLFGSTSSLFGANKSSGLFGNTSGGESSLKTSDRAPTGLFAAAAAGAGTGSSGTSGVSASGPTPGSGSEAPKLDFPGLCKNEGSKSPLADTSRTSLFGSGSGGMNSGLFGGTGAGNNNSLVTSSLFGPKKEDKSANNNTSLFGGSNTTPTNTNTTKTNNSIFDGGSGAKSGNPPPSTSGLFSNNNTSNNSGSGMGGLFGNSTSNTGLGIFAPNASTTTTGNDKQTELKGSLLNEQNNNDGTKKETESGSGNNNNNKNSNTSNNTDNQNLRPSQLLFPVNDPNSGGGTSSSSSSNPLVPNSLTKANANSNSSSSDNLNPTARVNESSCSSSNPNPNSNPNESQNSSSQLHSSSTPIFGALNQPMVNGSNTANLAEKSSSSTDMPKFSLTGNVASSMTKGGEKVVVPTAITAPSDKQKQESEKSGGASLFGNGSNNATTTSFFSPLFPIPAPKTEEKSSTTATGSGAGSGLGSGIGSLFSNSNNSNLEGKDATKKDALVSNSDGKSGHLFNNNTAPTATTNIENTTKSSAESAKFKIPDPKTTTGSGLGSGSLFGPGPRTETTSLLTTGLLFTNVGDTKESAVSSSNNANTEPVSSQEQPPKQLLMSFSNTSANEGDKSNSSTEHKEAKSGFKKFSFKTIPEESSENEQNDKKPSESHQTEPSPLSEAQRLRSSMNMSNEGSLVRNPTQGDKKSTMLDSSISEKNDQRQELERSTAGRVTSSNINRASSQQSFFATEQQKKQQQKEKENSSSTSRTPSHEVITALGIARILEREAAKRRFNLSSSSVSAPERLDREILKKIEDWIGVSFTRHNTSTQFQLQPNTNLPNLHENPDVNRFLGDISSYLITFLNLPPTSQSILLTNALFLEILDKLGLHSSLFNEYELNREYFLKQKIYRFSESGAELNLDSPELRLYILSTIRKFVSNQIEYLEFVSVRKTEMLKQPSQLLWSFLVYSLTLKPYRLEELGFSSDNEFVQAISDFERKVISKVVSLIDGYVGEYGSTLQLIKRERLNELLILLEDYSLRDEGVINVSLKVVLNMLDLGKLMTIRGSTFKQTNEEIVGKGINPNPRNNVSTPNPEVLRTIKESKSLQLLPFRTILSGISGNSTKNNTMIAPAAADLYKYVQGFEWLDWLEVYLNSDKEKELQAEETKYLLNILKPPKSSSKNSYNTSSFSSPLFSHPSDTQSSHHHPSYHNYLEAIETKVLGRKRPIYKLIMALKEENMLETFYQILRSLIHDYESYRRVEEAFFKQKGEFNYEFKGVIAEVANYPIQKLNQEIPFMEDKLLYFLRIVEVAPQKTLTLERDLFDGPLVGGRFQANEESVTTASTTKRVADVNQTGHKICHYIIDAISYYSLSSRLNQTIIAKCLACIVSLLKCEETHEFMKIAMCINKPEMNFLSAEIENRNGLRNSHSPFNSFNMHLSSKLARSINSLLCYFLQNTQSFTNSLAVNLEDHSEEMGKMYGLRYSYNEYLPYVRCLQETEGLIVTIPSYWIYKMLQGMYGSASSAAIGSGLSSSLSSSTLYAINLILEKLFIIPPTLMDERISETSTKQLPSHQNTESNILDSSAETSECPPPLQNYTSSSSSRVLNYLIEALNRLPLLELLTSQLRYRVIRRSSKYNQKLQRKETTYCIVNCQLEDNPEENWESVFLALRGYKLLFRLYRIHNEETSGIGSRGFENNHFAKNALKNMKFFQDVERFFLTPYALGQTAATFSSTSSSSTSEKQNGIISFMAFLLSPKGSESDAECASNQTESNFFPFPSLNTKSQFEQTEWIAAEKGATLEAVETFYRVNNKNLNYEAVNSFMAYTDDKYVESTESLQSLAFECLSILVQSQSPFQSDQTSSYSFNSNNSSNSHSVNLSRHVGLNTSLECATDNKIVANGWIMENFEKNITRLLISDTTPLKFKELIMQFIIKCRGVSENHKVSMRIFYAFMKEASLSGSSSFSQSVNSKQYVRLNSLICNILSYELENFPQMFSDEISERHLNQYLKHVLTSYDIAHKTVEPSKVLRLWSEKKYDEEMNFSNLERLLQERSIIALSQGYDTVYHIINILLNRFFANKDRYDAFSILTNLVVRNGLLYLGCNLVDSNGNFSVNSQQRIIGSKRLESMLMINDHPPRKLFKDPLDVYLREVSSSNGEEGSDGNTNSILRRCFEIYKTNISQYLEHYAVKLNNRLNTFMRFILSVDTTLYGNQSIQASTILNRESVPAAETIFCHLHAGEFQHTAVEMFAYGGGLSSSDSISTSSPSLSAIETVKDLFDQSFDRLQQGMETDQLQCFAIMGALLEWLRARGPEAEGILHALCKDTLSKEFWLSDHTLQFAEVVKLLLSLVNVVMGRSKTVSNNKSNKNIGSSATSSTSTSINKTTLKTIKTAVIQCVHNYCHTHGHGHNNSVHHSQKHHHNYMNNESDIVFQELLSVLIMLPLDSAETNGNLFRDVLSIWASETNDQYFNNESRVILEWAVKYPNELAKLRPLTGNNKRLKRLLAGYGSGYGIPSASSSMLSSSELPNNQFSTTATFSPSISQPQYDAYGNRNPTSLSWLWCVKIASALMSSEDESLTICQEVGEFFNQHQPKFIELFSEKGNPLHNLSSGHLDEIISAVELFYTLIGSRTWVALNHRIFEEVTYLLGNRMIVLCMGYFATSGVRFIARSDLEKRLNRLYYGEGGIRAGLLYQGLSGQPSDNMIDFLHLYKEPGYESDSNQDSMFKLMMELKMLSMLKLFNLTFSKCLEQSWMVEKYFQEQVHQNLRYSVAYWDTMNKALIDLVRWCTVTLQKRWKRCDYLDQKLVLLKDSLSSAEYFVDTGYLNVLSSDIPRNTSEMFREVYFLTLSSFELSTVHLILEQKFRIKFNSLLKSHLDNFAKKLIYNAKILSTDYRNEKWDSDWSDFIKKETFDDIIDNIQGLVRLDKEYGR